MFVRHGCLCGMDIDPLSDVQRISFLCRRHGLQADGHIIRYTIMLEWVLTSTVNTTFIYWAKYHLTISCNKRNVPHITSIPGLPDDEPIGLMEFMETSLTFQVAQGQRWALRPLLTPVSTTQLTDTIWVYVTVHIRQSPPSYVSLILHLSLQALCWGELNLGMSSFIYFLTCFPIIHFHLLRWYIFYFVFELVVEYIHNRYCI